MKNKNSNKENKTIINSIGNSVKQINNHTDYYELYNLFCN